MYVVINKLVNFHDIWLIFHIFILDMILLILNLSIIFLISITFWLIVKSIWRYEHIVRAIWTHSSLLFTCLYIILFFCILSCSAFKKIDGFLLFFVNNTFILNWFRLRLRWRLRRIRGLWAIWAITRFWWGGWRRRLRW